VTQHADLGFRIPSEESVSAVTSAQTIEQKIVSRIFCTNC
jgi:hypothetical protein